MPPQVVTGNRGPPCDTCGWPKYGPYGPVDFTYPICTTCQGGGKQQDGVTPCGSCGGAGSFATPLTWCTERSHAPYRAS
ncbi:hypothetical protein LA080_007637 [Diaporthe eres]|nr:hypothetical protein LA080_007637 [Diaporthe eres]